MKQQPKMLALQLDKQQFVMEMMENRRLNNAKIIELEARAALEMEEAGGVKEGHRIAAFAAAIGAMRAHDEHLKSRIDQMLKQMELENDASADGGGVGKPPATPSLPSLPGITSAAAGVV